MNLGDIHRLVRTSLGRGTALDADIPYYVEQAVMWIERNATLSYMDRFGEFDIDPETEENPRIVSLPREIKAVNFVRFVSLDGTDYQYTYIPRISPEEVTEKQSGQPTAYWVTSGKLIIFDNEPDEALDVEISWAAFTEWNRAEDFTHWLITHASDLLIAQTMFLMAVYTRDPRMLQMYMQQRDEALKTLLSADDDLRYQDRDISMIYGASQ